jgi:hypothetical protein
MRMAASYSASSRSSSFEMFIRLSSALPVDEIKHGLKFIQHSQKADSELIAFFESNKKEQTVNEYFLIIKKKPNAQAYIKKKEANSSVQVRKTLSFSNNFLSYNNNNNNKLAATNENDIQQQQQQQLQLPQIQSNLINIKSSSDDHQAAAAAAVADEKRLVLVDKITWRNRFEDFYENLQVNHSTSYRKAAKKPSESNGEATTAAASNSLPKENNNNGGGGAAAASSNSPPGGGGGASNVAGNQQQHPAAPKKTSSRAMSAMRK